MAMQIVNTPEQADYSAAPVRVAWRDHQHQLHCVVGHCIDVSAKRIHIQVPQRIPLNESVSLVGGGISENGPARVRYVTNYNREYILVLDRL
jgi:hypothetical protein